MNDQIRKTSNQRANFKRRRIHKGSLGLVFGAILGLIIGNMLGSLALGLIFGAGMGLIFGFALDYRCKSKRKLSDK